MKVGVVLPMSDDDGDGVPSWDTILGLARRAEEGGVDSIWLYDHLLFRLEGEREAGIHEAWTLLAALAATTRRVDLGTIVLATSFRPPALLAKMAATADAISGGRLILGLGTGWHEPEYRAFGYPFDHRVSRFEEAIAVILPLLRGERVTRQGRWTWVQDAVLLPPPVRPGGLPILMAAKGERMLRLTACHADAWNTAWYGLPDERYRQRRASLVEACAAKGRDPATLEVTVGLTLDTSGAAARPGAAAPLPGDVSAVADAFATWAAEGVGHVQVDLRPASEATLDILLDAAARFRA